jgi:WD40 repeat protein
MSLAFSPDGTLLASAGRDGALLIWNLHSRNLAHPPIFGHHDSVSDITFSPDSRLLASASCYEKTPYGECESGEVRLWDVATGHAIGQPFIGRHGDIVGLSFQSDGRTVLSGHYDGSMVLWDVNPDSWIRKACDIANRNLTSTEWQRYLETEPYQETCAALRSRVGME